MIQIRYESADGGIHFSSGGLEVLVPEDAVRRAMAFVPTASLVSVTDPMTLEENHPMWQHYSGGSRESGMAWTMSDAIEDAKALRRHLPSMGSTFFEMLLAEPGRLFTSQEIMDAHPMFDKPQTISGCLSGFSKPCRESGRPLPFFWWDGKKGTPSRYAVRPSVARVFLAAGG